MPPRRAVARPRAGISAIGAWRRGRIFLRLGMHRLSRLRASPHEIALGCAIGAFISITPLLGVQTLLALLLAALLRASLPAAIVGTFLGNPLSWPLIWISTYATGLQMIGIEGVLDPAAFERGVVHVWAALIAHSPHVLDAAMGLLWPVLLPMLAGSLPVGLLTAAIVYYIARNVVYAWRHRRASTASAAAD
jgi:uncharacterized protein